MIGSLYVSNVPETQMVFMKPVNYNHVNSCPMLCFQTLRNTRSLQEFKYTTINTPLAE